MTKLKITSKESEALERLSFDKWLSAFDSRIAMDTLQRMVDKGLLKKKMGMGAMSSPLSGIKFMKNRIIPEYDIIKPERMELKQPRKLKRRKKRKLKRRKK